MMGNEEQSIQVTLGVCVRNSEMTVGQALASILDQSFPHRMMEIVVVDGCSSDNTLEIIKTSISKIDIDVKVSSNGRGLGAQRQEVVNRARGDLIVWVDGDTTLPENYVRDLVRFMKVDPNLGAAQGICMYEEKTLLDTFCNLVTVSTRANLVSSDQRKIGTGGGICRVEALKKVGGFDESIRGAGEDADLASRLRSAGWRLAVVDTNFYHQSHGWKSLWSQYLWYGYGMHYVNHKRGTLTVPLHYSPLIAFFGGLRAAAAVYRITHVRISFLLSLQRAFEGFAWCVGFTRSHLDKYGHARGSTKWERQR